MKRGSNKKRSILESSVTSGHLHERRFGAVTRGENDEFATLVARQDTPRDPEQPVPALARLPRLHGALLVAEPCARIAARAEIAEGGAPVLHDAPRIGSQHRIAAAYRRCSRSAAARTRSPRRNRARDGE